MIKLILKGHCVSCLLLPRDLCLSFKVTTPPIPAFGTQYPVMNWDGSNDLNRLLPWTLIFWGAAKADEQSFSFAVFLSPVEIALCDGEGCLKEETEKVSNLSAPGKGNTYFFFCYGVEKKKKKKDQESFESITQGLETDKCKSSKAVTSESSKLCPLIPSMPSPKFRDLSKLILLISSARMRYGRGLVRNSRSLTHQ